jgi:hypothetical protein
MDRQKYENSIDEVVSLGLAPLSGPVVWPLRIARVIARPLYDFGSLRAFKQRMHPGRWQPTWLVYPRGSGGRAMADSLRAFADEPLWRFGMRSLIRHPSGLPWLLAVPLVPWSLSLAIMALVGDRDILGFSPAMLAAWAGWDAVLAALLFRVARHPRRRHLGWLAGAAAGDAVLSLVHVARTGLGRGITPIFRLAAATAPVFGALALLWAATRESRARAGSCARRER